jgi:FkbM family methyltransferase
MKWYDSPRCFLIVSRPNIVLSVQRNAMTSEDVRRAYQVLLGRNIESDALATRFAQHYVHELDLVIDLLKSEEFLAGRGQRLAGYSIPALHDISIFREFGQYTGSGQNGFVTDFLGIRTDVRFISHLSAMDGTVEHYPFPHGNFHGDITEWIGTLTTVLEAQNSFTILELGAGWAPWLVVCAKAAAIRGIKDIRLVGVEASSSHAAFMKQHVANNEISPNGHLLLHGAVGTKDGEADFPIAADPSADWGQAALFDGIPPDGKDYRGQPITTTERVKVYSLATLLREQSVVDLIHVDVQGAEGDVIQAGLEALNRKVKALVIGTHGRAIEARLMQLMLSEGWLLGRDSACRVGLGNQSGVLAADGCQFWQNSRFMSER